LKNPSLDPYTLKNTKFERDGPSLVNNALWQRTIENYSGCGLSKPQSDKLIAISGIARRIFDAEK
jgi:hypothetical protein